MPTLSMFFGIIVRMYAEAGGQHSTPHVHAEYSGDEIVISFDGEIIEGDMPKAKLKLLLAWMVIHRDELEADWRLLIAGETAFKIDPLR